MKSDHWRNVRLDLEKTDVSTLGTADCKALLSHVFLVLHEVDQASYTNEISKSEVSAILRTTGRLIRELKGKL